MIGKISVITSIPIVGIIFMMISVITLSKRDDANLMQNGFDYTSFDQLLTPEGFPFTVDHESNYVKYAGAFGGPGGEYGGIPQHWHIEYCKGQPLV